MDIKLENPSLLHNQLGTGSPPLYNQLGNGSKFGQSTLLQVLSLARALVSYLTRFPVGYIVGAVYQSGYNV